MAPLPCLGARRFCAPFACTRPQFTNRSLERPGCQRSGEGRTMPGADRRGFDWKEIAEVLQIAGVSSRVTFLHEIRGLVVHKEESNSDSVKPDKLPDERGEKLFLNVVSSLRRRRPDRSRKR